MTVCSTLSFTPTKKQTKMIYIVLGVIILLSLFIRILYFNQNPPGLNQDEAMHGVNAYSISKTLMDHKGFFLPAQMHGFGNIGIVSSLYTYLSVPFVGIGGLSETTVRIVALLINLALLIVVFFLTSGLFHNKIIGLLASALLGLNPWCLHYSRIAHEATLSPFFYMLICFLLYLVLFSDNHKKLIPAAGIVLGLSFYTYQVAWVMSPIIVLFICFLFFKETVKRYKEILIVLGIAFVITFPLIFMNVIAPEPWMESRLDSVSFFSKPDGLNQIFTNFLYFFSPDFLFLKGDMHIWTLPGNAQHYGMFHPYIIVFFLSGIVFLMVHLFAKKERRREIILIIGLALIYALPASATEPIGWSLRAYTLIPAFHIIAGIGIWVLITSIPVVPFTLHSKKLSRLLKHSLSGLIGIVITVYIFSQAVPFLINYYTVYPTMPENFGAYQYGMKDVCIFIKENQEKYRKIYITRDINQPFVYVLFYTGFDPATYHRIKKDENPLEWGAVFQFDKYYFKWEKDMNLRENSALFITRWQTPLKGKKLLKQIPDPRGDIQFQIWE
ncbi:MAG: glycosyltransferase family 39 protein [Spirochaetales bacterium]|nr:glycosyltransferase family 39 protein [Spirochaetales bacterium]